MKTTLWIAAGAILGANARYWVGIWAAARFGTGLPYGTLIVNLAGSFLLGFLVVLGTSRIGLPTEIRLFLAVGFLGSFTTFSSYSAETLLLQESAGTTRALTNILANNGGGLIAAWFGATLARALG